MKSLEAVAPLDSPSAAIPKAALVAAESHVPRYGVVDIGSNSIRLVIFAGLESVPAPLFNEKALCGLGRDLMKTGRLNPKGAQLALSSIERYKHLADSLNVDRLDLLATAAVREASDGPEFVDKIKQSLGLSVSVLSGQEEAHLSALGVIWGSPMASGIIGDLGGGSLELIAVDQGKVVRAETLPLGALRLLKVKDKNGKELRRVIDRELERIDWLSQGSGSSFYAVGGTWRSLARVQMELDEHPLRIIHGLCLPTRKVRDAARLLAQQTRPSLSKILSVSATRLETLPVAGAVMNRVLSKIRPDQVTFSAYGLREGWLYGHLPHSLRQADPLLGAARDAAGRDPCLDVHSNELLAWTAPLFPVENARHLRLRRVVCELYDLSWREHPDYRAAGSLERILRWPFLPADHGERAYIGLALYWRYGGGPDPAVVQNLLRAEERDRAQLLGLALRLADTVSGGTQTGLARFSLQIRNRRLILKRPKQRGSGDCELIKRRFAQLQKFFDRKDLLLS